MSAEESRGPRAFAVPPLHPYLPDQWLLRRLTAGLGVLADRAWRGTGRGLRRGAAALEDKSQESGADSSPDRLGSMADAAEKGGRVVLVVVIGVGAGGGAVATTWLLLRPFLPWITAVGLLAVVAAALAVAPDERRPEAKTKPIAEREASPANVTDLTVEQIAHAVRQIAAERGWSGTHLTDLEEHLGATREALLDTLAESGIEVAEQLKLRLSDGRQRNRQGVRLTALPAGLGEAPEPAAQHPASTPAEGPPEAVDRTLPDPAPATVYGAE